MAVALNKSVNYFKTNPRDFFEGVEHVAKGFRMASLSEPNRSQAAKVASAASRVWEGLVWLQLPLATQELIQSVHAIYASGAIYASRAMGPRVLEEVGRIERNKEGNRTELTAEKVNTCIKKTLLFVATSVEALNHLPRIVRAVKLGQNAQVLKTVFLSAYLAADVFEAAETCVDIRRLNRQSEARSAAMLKLTRLALSVFLTACALWAVAVGVPLLAASASVGLTLLTLGLKIAESETPKMSNVSNPIPVGGGI